LDHGIRQDFQQEKGTRINYVSKKGDCFGKQRTCNSMEGTPMKT